MTPPATSPRPWALWTTLLAMLLALQVSAGAIRPIELAGSGASAARLSLPAPLAAQFRDTGHALKAAGQRLNTAKPHDSPDGASPPLPYRTLTLPRPVALGESRHVYATVARHGDARASAYRARAPPLPA